MHRNHSDAGREHTAAPLDDASRHAAPKGGIMSQTQRSDCPTGRTVRMRTPRGRSEDQRVNLRRSYQARVRKLKSNGESGEAAYRPWPIRPYAASI